MIITASSQDLLKELDYLTKVMPSKPKLPILSNVLIQAAADGMKMAATNLEVGLVTFCPAQVQTPGSTTLPAKHLFDILRLLPNRMVTLTLDGHTAELTSGRYTTKLPTFSAANYPALPSMRGVPTTPLPAAFHTAIKNVHFAISKKDQKHLVSGALFTGRELIALDGHRLALTALSDTSAEPILISKRVLDVLLDLGGEQESELAVSERHLFFVMDGRMLFATRLDGTFPNYERIIPKDFAHSAIVPREAFRDAVERVVLTNRDVLLQFNATTVTLSGRSAESGEAMEQVDATYQGAETASLQLRGSYLLDFLEQAAQPNLTLSWRDEGAVLFGDGPAYIYVQMPVR